MKNTNQLTKVIRIIARVWAVLGIAFLLFMILGHIFGSEPQQVNGMNDVLSLAFFPTGVLIGLLLAWRWDGLGGIITIASMIGLYILRPDLTFDLFTLALAVPGVLFLVYWLLNRQPKVSVS